MTDEYAKTLVIDDPNYAPGAIISPAALANAKPQQTVPAIDACAHADGDEELPDFDDTSWLT